MLLIKVNFGEIETEESHATVMADIGLTTSGKTLTFLMTVYPKEDSTPFDEQYKAIQHKYREPWLEIFTPLMVEADNEPFLRFADFYRVFNRNDKPLGSKAQLACIAKMPAEFRDKWWQHRNQLHDKDILFRIETEWLKENNLDKVMVGGYMRQYGCSGSFPRLKVDNEDLEVFCDVFGISRRALKANLPVFVKMDCSVELSLRDNKIFYKNDTTGMYTRIMRK